MSTYKLTLHKKSYLLTGIKKDDSNKEKVKQLGAKWNGSLGGWLFFPDKHKEGLKFAKEIGAEIDEKIKEEKSPKKESKEKKKEFKEEKKELMELVELKDLFIEFANNLCNTIDSFEGLDDDMVQLKWNEFLPQLKNKFSDKKKVKKQIKHEIQNE